MSVSEHPPVSTMPRYSRIINGDGRAQGHARIKWYLDFNRLEHAMVLVNEPERNIGRDLRRVDEIAEIGHGK